MSEAQNPPTAEPFAVLLQRFRARAALSQDALAAKSGLSSRAISDLERGVKTRPHLDTVRMLGDALGLDKAEWAQFLAAARPAKPAPARRPPPRPTSAPVLRGLPVTSAPLVGRQAELVAVARSVREWSTPLVTLTGAGGVGKTRLAIAIAQEVAVDFPDGVTWVDLTPLVDPGLVPIAVASALGVGEESRRPPAESIRQELTGKRCLLVLDNCEHVRGAVSALVAELLRACPELTVLATSRSRLRLSREQIVRIEPLEVPPLLPQPALDQVAGADAVQLFVQTARRSRSDFQVTEVNAADVAAICRRLDGLPLAIELATAKLRVLAPASLRSMLDERFQLLTSGDEDAPAHHRTLEAALAWSYEQLTAEGKRALQAISVFAGGCSFDGLKAALGSQDPITVLTCLEELVDQSLIQAVPLASGDLRYRMLETVRAYGNARLAESGEQEAVRDRHAAFYLEMAEAADANLSGPEQVTWLRRLDEERDNLRAALVWLEERGDQSASLRLATALWSYWDRRGGMDEARGWLERALSIETAETALQARAWHRLGNFYISLGNYPQAQRTYARSLEIARRIDDQTAIANALNGLGIVAADTGDLDRAREYHEEALGIRTQLGDEAGRARSLFNLGLVSTWRGEFSAARAHLEQSLEIGHFRGDTAGQAYFDWAMGRVSLRAGDLAVARNHFDRCIRVFEELGDDPGVGATLTELGYLACLQGHHQKAIQCLRKSLSIEFNLEDKLGIALCLERFAVAAARINQSRVGATMLGAAQAYRDSMGTPVPEVDQHVNDSTARECITAIGEDTYLSAFEQGRNLRESELLDLADMLDD